MLQWLSELWTYVYRYHYGLGLHTARLVRRLGRWLHRVSRPLRRLCRYLWLRRVVLPLHRFRRKVRNLSGRIKPSFRLMGRMAKEKNPLAVVPCFLRLCRSAVRHYWEELASLGRILGPVAAVVLLSLTVGSWSGTEYYLNVQYRGAELGVVENAEVYTAGAAMARERVINANNEFKVDAVPVFTMTMQKHQSPLTEEQVCDAILRASQSDLAEATGLYVSGKFIGAMESKEELNTLLDTIRQERLEATPKGEGDEVKVDKVEFVQTLKKTDGLYPISAVCDEAVLKEKLDVLTIKVIQIVTTTEIIPHKSNTVYRDDMYTDEKPRITEGQDGEQEVVTEITRVDGKITKTKVVKTTVTKKAVAEVTEKGTKKRVPTGGTVQGDGVAHGNMLWPVPICHSMSRGYKAGHYALDICNGPVPVYGHPAVAADGGTVVYAGWYYDYGYYVKIDHGNGLETTYAHLSAIKVKKGQKVSRGQTVGLIGSTGRSTGPHLHFEVIKNGVKMNPLNYVKP